MNRTEDVKFALETLDNMEEIVANEMLIQGTYGQFEPGNLRSEELYQSGSICGGVQACAIGSMLLAHPTFGHEVKRFLWAGIKKKYRTTSRAFDRRSEAWYAAVSGDPKRRDREYAKWPGLGLAFDALNQAAEQYSEEERVPLHAGFASSVEALFESVTMGYMSMRLRNAEMLKVIERAKTIVTVGAPTLA